METTTIRLEHIFKTYDDKKVLDDFNLDIHHNEFVTLLGPSGCGKTTTLRIIGGFEQPDSGRVLFDGEDITGVAPEQRRVNTVFQKYSLFSHMDVADNIAFGLKMKKKSRSYINDKIKYALHLVDLDGFEHRRPESLSGGQQQRVAIARAVVNEPSVLLLDEPLSALDKKLRHEMQQELIRLKKELGITFLFVTHDQEEALTMSDRIIVMNQGLILQDGSPTDIYNEPQNAFVADFIGQSNIFDGIMHEDFLVEIAGRKYNCVDTGFSPHEKVDVVIRPEDVELREENEDLPNGVVTSLLFKGVQYEMHIQADGLEWLAHSTVARPVGKHVGLYVLPENIQVMHKPMLSAQRIAAHE